jgi:hypothetical protein
VLSLNRRPFRGRHSGASRRKGIAAAFSRADPFHPTSEGKSELWSMHIDRHICPRYMWRRCFQVCLLGLFLPIMAQAKRQDLMIMKNGDRLTGQAKKLESRILYVSLDYVSASVGLDRLKVERVESSAGFPGGPEDWERLQGIIKKAPRSEAAGNDFELSGQARILRLSGPMWSILNRRNATSARTDWLDRFRLQLYQRQRQTQTNTDANGRYLTTRWSSNKVLPLPSAINPVSRGQILRKSR